MEPWLEFQEKSPQGWTEFQYMGYRCIIWLFPELLTLNGYVILPKEHLYYRVPITWENMPIDCHGDLTFGDMLDNISPELANKYAIGFDCAHATDFIPKFDYLNRRSCPWRNEEFVKNELISIINQLEELVKEVGE